MVNLLDLHLLLNVLNVPQENIVLEEEHQLLVTAMLDLCVLLDLQFQTLEQVRMCLTLMPLLLGENVLRAISVSLDLTTQSPVLRALTRV